MLKLTIQIVMNEELISMDINQGDQLVSHATIYRDQPNLIGMPAADQLGSILATELDILGVRYAS